MALDYEKSSEFLKALANPTRLRIVKGLLEDKCSVGHIAEVLNKPQSTISQHLALLKLNGIIVPEKKGVVTCYRVKDRRVEDIIKIIEEDI